MVGGKKEQYRDNFKEASDGNSTTSLERNEALMEYITKCLDSTNKL